MSAASKRKPTPPRVMARQKLVDAIALLVKSGVMTKGEKYRFMALIDAQFADLFVERKKA